MTGRDGRGGEGRPARAGGGHGRARGRAEIPQAGRSRLNACEDRATPGGYGGKPPGVAFIGVPTGARNAGRCSDGGPEHRYACYTETPPSASRPDYEGSRRGAVFSNRGTGCPHRERVNSTGGAVVAPPGRRSAAAVTGICWPRPGRATIGG